MLTRGGELQMSFTVMPAGDPQTRVQRDFLRGTLVGHFRGTIFQRIAFPGGASGKESTCQRRRCRRWRFYPWVGKIPWRRKWQPTPVFLAGKSHGRRSLAGYSPWGHKESDMTEHARMYCFQKLIYLRSYLRWIFPLWPPLLQNLSAQIIEEKPTFTYQESYYETWPWDFKACRATGRGTVQWVL